MRRLFYLLIPFCVAVAPACGDSHEPEKDKPAEELARNHDEEPAEMPVPDEQVKNEFPDVTPEMMVAFKRFREAVVNRDAVRLASMMSKERLENGCAYEGDRTIDAAGLVNILDEAQLEVLKKRIETTVNTDTKKTGCIYKDSFTVDDDKQGFSWMVGCTNLVEEEIENDEIGEYGTIFQFRKAGGKYKLVGVTCAG